jgi:hypothetical protein
MGIAILVVAPEWHGGGTHMADFETAPIVNEHRAAVLLGIAPLELRWFSRVLGLGSNQEFEDGTQIVFTYDELRRLSSAAAASAK